MIQENRRSVARLSLFGVCTLFTAVASSNRLVAQTAVDGAVAGTVVDNSGAALPNAAIIVHSTATNADITVTGDAAGYSTASNSPPSTTPPTR